PCFRQPLVRAVINGLHDADLWPLTWLHSAGRGDRLRDRHADLEVENAGLHAEVMREDGPRRADALRAERRHAFLDCGAEDLRHLLARNPEVNDRYRRGFELGDTRRLDHDMPPVPNGHCDLSRRAEAEIDVFSGSDPLDSVQGV